jgi:hypothetical protein
VPRFRSQLALYALTVGASLGAGVRVASAQDRLLTAGSGALAPTFDYWKFGSGLWQPTPDGRDSVGITRVTQFSIPLSFTVPIGSVWAMDVSAAYASATVTLASPDAQTGKKEYALNGLTDVRVRATGRFANDRVLFTVGVNAPSGATKLDDEQLRAARVVASPALSLATPVLGTGPGATAGVVVAREVGGWALAFGGSYEVRSEYSPVSLAGGIPTPDFNPGDVVHLSLGSDGLVGGGAMTLSLSADVFSNDKLSVGTAAAAATDTKLGPVLTADWQYRFPSTTFSDITVYAVDRFRGKYERAGASVPKSSGNYLDAGLRLLYPLSTTLGLITAGNFRHQTGLESDNTIATAAFRAGAVSLGLTKRLGNFDLQPLVRAQAGTIKSAGVSASSTTVSGGVTFGLRF